MADDANSEDSRGTSGERTVTSRLISDRPSGDDILRSARLPFLIGLVSILSIPALLFAQAALKVSFFQIDINTDDGAAARFFLRNAIYIGLFLVGVVSCFIGYRMVVAAGATTSPVILPEDRNLLEPLVSDGKSESIDQYIKLSSLKKFTGTFTQLGLTGLPLATIFLTLFFSILAIINESQFLDLAKLTLGAFIGSFVQRQVERQQGAGSEDENGADNATGLREDRTPKSAV